MTQTVLVQKKDGRRRPLTEEHRAKQRAAWTPERRAEQSAKMKIIMTGENNSFFGKTHSVKQKAKLSASMIGENNPNFGGLSEEHRAKISAAWTPERKAKLRAAWTGENNPAKRPEVRAKLREAWTGRVVSEEHKAKNSVAHTGKTHSEETRAKMSGENNGSWKGGISYLPYCSKFDNLLKEHYRNAYGRICAYCGKPEILNGHRLSVHHVDGNKMQGCDGHDWFLVPLCRSCNSKGFERKPEYVFLFWLKDIERKHRRQQQ